MGGENLSLEDMVKDIHRRMIDESGVMARLDEKQKSQMEDIMRVDKMAKSTKKAVHGENGDYKNGLEFKFDRLYDAWIATNTMEKNCPGRNIEALKKEIFERFEKTEDKVEGYLQTIEKVALLKTGEEQGRAKAKEQNDADKKKWWGWFITVVQTYPVRVLITFLLTSLLGIGLTWFGVSHERINNAKEKIKNGVEKTLDKNI
jgi:hypothetical protein